MNKSEIIKNFQNGTLKINKIPPDYFCDIQFSIDICNISQKSLGHIYDNYEELFNNKEFILGIFEKNKACFSYLSQELRANKNFWIDILTIDPYTHLIFENIQFYYNIIFIFS